MSDWHEHAYAGGPMVELPGFPRPLYPPDASAHGKKPSSDGPDVVAYKRTVSRAGRWPWQTFDDAYSNGFAHGDGPNVVDTGIAGVQRQMDIDASGWIGKATFNTLRSIRVPEGKPHAGEMAMDGVAQELLVEAWELYGGHEPADDHSHFRVRALDLAITQIGVKEYPPESNDVFYCDWYGMRGPWCAMFVTWCFEDSHDTAAFVRGQRYAYVPYLLADAREWRYGLSVTDDPIPGDLVLFDWAFDGEFDHIGIFEKWTGTESFTAIEGNTSTSNDSNGGEVMRRTRNLSGQSTRFVRVA